MISIIEMRLFLIEFFATDNSVPNYYKSCLAFEVCRDYSFVTGTQLEQIDPYFARILVWFRYFF